MQAIGLTDLIITPFYLIIIYFIAYTSQRKIKDKSIKKYFIPALSVKIIGAIGVGLVYKYIYVWGDTFFFFAGSGVIYETFPSKLDKFIHLVFYPTTHDVAPIINWVGRTGYYYDAPSYMVIRFSAICDIFSFHTYIVNAIFFACFSFIGVWAMFKMVIDIYPNLKKEAALAIFFFPSVFFWGSGLLKDTITFGALSFAISAFYFGIIKSEKRLQNIIIFTIACFFLRFTKIYILLAFLPTCGLWLNMRFGSKIKSAFLRALIMPFMLTLFGVGAYFGIGEIAQGTDYSLDAIATETKITSEYLYKVSKEGRAYKIGELDGTFASMIKLAPQAIFISLFRPFFWESRSPVMLLAGLENAYLALLTLLVFWRVSIFKIIKTIRNEEFVLVALAFVIPFAFFIGVASSNFGTLVRYKIPMMPLYALSLFIILHKNKKRKKTKPKSQFEKNIEAARLQELRARQK